MAQHDYVIDNQAFPATRADLNSVLQAIVTNNSGSSAPSTTFANQIWYDSSANILYIRNEDNDANIPLLQLDQSADVAATLATIIDVLDKSGTNTAGTDLTIRAGAGTGTGAGGNIILQTANAGSSGSSVNSHATAVTVDDGGQVGIGTTPTAQLHVSGDDTTNQVIIENTSADADNAPDLLLKRNSSSPADNDEVGQIVFQGRNDNSQFPTLATMRVIYKDVTDTTEDAALAYELMTGGTKSEVMRLDGGSVLIGQTANDSTVAGHIFSSNGTAFHVRDGGTVFVVNRLSSDGNLTSFRSDNTNIGFINTRSSQLNIGSGDTGLEFNTSDAVLPHDSSNNTGRDNAIDLGSSSLRFDDIFATNTSIQTSDQNEKQDIASLTDTEITAAKAISKLFKTYKWKDKVASKGDSARTHSGVIAQDVSSAMTDAGLDAADYAFWCSDTWWETQTEVPAVEANAENEIEAKDAYTRTDIYKTADEAPEGATQRTRLGIRYPELLAFIGAATEQRLTSIETRLTALEG